MTTLTLTLSTMLPDGQEVYQQVQLDQPALTDSALLSAYGTLKSDFTTYLAKQTTV